MVERLCRDYGTPLVPSSAPAAGDCDLAAGGASHAAVGPLEQPLELYAFPTLEQLSLATEEHLRAAGFGYR